MEKGALTRGRILDEAMRLASRGGLEGLTIGTLAEVLSLSKSGLFRHFGSKEALQVAVLEHVAERSRAKMLPRLQAAEPGLGQLEALVLGFMDWIDDPDLPGGCPVVGACFELDDKPGTPRDRLVALQEAGRARQAGMVRAAMARGELRADTPVAQVLFQLRGITLAYHVATRVMGDPEARAHALEAFRALVDRYRP